MLDKLKRELRIKNNAFDEDIIDLIDAAKRDMQTLEINIDKTTDSGEIDPLIKMAITLYCKAYFGLDNPDSEKYLENYDNLRDFLRKSSDYKSVGDYNAI